MDLVRKLAVKLTAKELADKSDELARRLEEAGRLDLSLASVKADHKARADRLKAEIADLAQSIRQKCEYRDVACVERRDDEAMTVSLIRVDTGEQVEIRAMTLAEKQRALFPQAEAHVQPATDPAPEPDDRPLTREEVAALWPDLITQVKSGPDGNPEAYQEFLHHEVAEAFQAVGPGPHRAYQALLEQGGDLRELHRLMEMTWRLVLSDCLSPEPPVGEVQVEEMATPVSEPPAASGENVGQVF